MPSVCDKCGKNPVIFIRYSGQHLCADHFLDLLRRRVKKEMRLQRVFRKGRKIAVAVSGGKDSLLLLKLTHEIASVFKESDLVAVTIDEGIGGYRPSSVEITEKFTRENEIDWRLISYGEIFGHTLDEMVGSLKMGPCSICGILRRKALNTGASETGSGILLTGHNLDDTAQTILMNVMQADVSRLARLGPHLDPIEGFVPRAMPLRTTPETETYLAALLLGLPLHELECPYAESAKRGHYRDLIMKAEEETPGTRHSLLKFNEQVAPLIPRGDPKTNPCVNCGEPVIVSEGKSICRSCALMDRLKVGRGMINHEEKEA